MRKLLPLLFLLALTGCADRWSFVAFGDASPPDAEAAMPAVFGRMIERINQTDAVLALFAGDLVRGRTISSEVTAGQYDRALAVLKPLQARLLIVPGNHDIDGAGGAEEFAKRFGAVPWLITHRGWTFIGLSTEEPGTRGLIVGSQLHWLQETLARRPTQNKTVILMHRPVWPTVNEENRYHSLPQPELHRLFVEEGVTAVISGHEHHFHQETRDSIAYIITGGAGADLLPDGMHHFVYLQVRDAAISATNIQIQ